MVETNFLTLNVPHANTRPSSNRAAVWESPAVTCITLAGSSTSPGVNSASSLPSVTLPRAPSSLQPKTLIREFLLRYHSKMGDQGENDIFDDEILDYGLASFGSYLIPSILLIFGALTLFDV
ncbi:hypothetical protein HUJ04_003498 [Dendroctonus ponderosae]|nr:hypothetical protein HUJ04_003498 [Dendroctonus ponderosae]